MAPPPAALTARHGIGAVYCQADLADPGAVDRLMQMASDAFGGLDVVVNNAVVRHFAPVEEMSIADRSPGALVASTAAAARNVVSTAGLGVPAETSDGALAR